MWVLPPEFFLFFVDAPRRMTRIDLPFRESDWGTAALLWSGGNEFVMAGTGYYPSLSGGAIPRNETKKGYD